MKNAVSVCLKLVGFALCLSAAATTSATTNDSLTFEQIFVDFKSEARSERDFFYQKQQKLHLQLQAVSIEMEHLANKKKRRFYLALERKLQLMENLEALTAKSDLGILKIRYRKGIDLIRLMYEKILGLDHHFTGLHTYQYIHALSNPHSYPAFEKAKEALDKNKNKRYSMRLPGLLESNPFVAATFTLVSVLLGENSQTEKEVEVDKIACILDFTLRMNADLNIIRNETEFLKNANQNLKVECERLFVEYAKAVGYHATLEECRLQDDWEGLFEKLDEKTQSIEDGSANGDGPSLSLSKDLVNIEFATQRVSDFITKYSNFIGQGIQYYQKFDHIVNTYQNEGTCQEQLPSQFTELKADIKSTIDKFCNTYNLPEIQGSRLKDLMYGVVD